MRPRVTIDQIIGLLLALFCLVLVTAVYLLGGRLDH